YRYPTTICWRYRLWNWVTRLGRQFVAFPRPNGYWTDRYCCCQCPNASMDQNSWSSAYGEMKYDLVGMGCGCPCPGRSEHRPASSSILRYYQPRRGLACRVLHMGGGRIRTVGALVDLESAYRLRLSSHPLTSQRH